MRNTLIILTTIFVLFSCINSDKSKTTNETLNSGQHNETITNRSERQKLVEELKKLRQTISSADKEKIADIFAFPLSNESFGIYIDDKSYNEQLKANGNVTTKEMFMHHYEEIAESIWLEQLNNLFSYITIDSLLNKNTLKYEAYIKTEPCFYSYQIEVNNDTVILSMNMNSNRNYETKTFSENDIPENSSEFCEHNLWWIFTFNEDRLKLESINGAG